MTTVAVKVTLWPKFEGLGLELTVVGTPKPTAAAGRGEDATNAAHAMTTTTETAKRRLNLMLVSDRLLTTPMVDIAVTRSDCSYVPSPSISFVNCQNPQRLRLSTADDGLGSRVCPGWKRQHMSNRTTQLSLDNYLSAFRVEWHWDPMPHPSRT